MKTIKSINEKIEKLQSLKREMEGKMSKYCNDIAPNLEKNNKLETILTITFLTIIVFGSIGLQVGEFSDWLIYGVIFLIVSLCLVPFVYQLMSGINSESDYDIYLKNEKIETAIHGCIFEKTEIEKYYSFLNSIYNQELSILLKNEQKENEEEGSYHLIIRLFDKALARLNNEKVSLNLKIEKEE